IPKKPISPYPIRESAQIISGFGRGSSDLGIPTANIPISQTSKAFQALQPGVYFGYCSIHKNLNKRLGPQILATNNHINENNNIRRNIEFKYGFGLDEKNDLSVSLPQVMSVGYNPFYGNQEKSCEIHIIHNFKTDFYGAIIQFNILGYIRPELDFVNVQALIDDINLDIKSALEVLKKEEYKKY
ncbi:riboflavin kinase, partial [Ascoidea rubescens DSM 1968]